MNTPNESAPAGGELPPSCGPAETLSNETLVNVALQSAGRAAMYDNEIQHNRLMECRAELLRRLAAPQEGARVARCRDYPNCPNIECCAPADQTPQDGEADLPVGDDWQPIESIPRNGDRVQLLAANGKTDFGNWYAFAEWNEPSDDVTDHLNTDNGEGDYTHWRPLAAQEAARG